MHVSRDEIRKIVNRPYREDGTNFERDESNQQIMQVIEAGNDVILDETNLFESQRNTIRNGVIDIATVYYKNFLHISTEMCLNRNKLRIEEGERVPENSLKKMSSAAEQLSQDEYPIWG